MHDVIVTSRAPAGLLKAVLTSRAYDDKSYYSSAIGGCKLRVRRSRNYQRIRTIHLFRVWLCI